MSVQFEGNSAAAVPKEKTKLFVDVIKFKNGGLVPRLPATASSTSRRLVCWENPSMDIMILHTHSSVWVLAAFMVCTCSTASIKHLASSSSVANFIATHGVSRNKSIDHLAERDDSFRLPNSDILVIIKYPYGPQLLNAIDTEKCMGKVQASLFDTHKAEDRFLGILTKVEKSVGFAIVAVEPLPSPTLALTYMELWEILVYYSLFIEHQYTFLAQRYHVFRGMQHVAFGNIISFGPYSKIAST